MDVRAELEKVGAIYSAHFVGTSGKHLSGYCNNDPLMPHATLVSEFTKELVSSFKDDGVETVASPAVGAIPLSQWGAYHLSDMTKKEVLGVWADKAKTTDGSRAFVFEREGYLKAVKGKRVLILEDFVNTMYSMHAMVKAVREAGGEIIGIGCLEANKGVSAEAMDVPKFVKLTTIAYDAWTAEECLKVGLCSKNVPIVLDIGHGDDYQKLHPDYPGGYTKLLKD